VEHLVARAAGIAQRRRLELRSETRLDQPAVAMDAQLTNTLARAVELAGHMPHRMLSGAGHDAMIVARRMPAAMLFLRSPGGLSHHPDESVLAEDVAAALAVGLNFLEEMERGV
jgi:allantoate deiminase